MRKSWLLLLIILAGCSSEDSSNNNASEEQSVQSKDSCLLQTEALPVDSAETSPITTQTENYSDSATNELKVSTGTSVKPSATDQLAEGFERSKSLLGHRKMYLAIEKQLPGNSQKNASCDTDYGSEQVVVYTDKATGAVNKVVATSKVKQSVLTTQYYYKNDALFFALATMADPSISFEGNDNPDKSGPLIKPGEGYQEINRYYFNNNQIDMVLHWQGSLKDKPREFTNMPMSVQIRTYQGRLVKSGLVKRDLGLGVIKCKELAEAWNRY